MTITLIAKKGIPSVFVALLIFSFSSCNNQTKSTPVKEKEEVQQVVETAPPTPPEEKEEEEQGGQIYTGEATYYADSYHGKPTSSGELYDKNKYTAAVRFNALPLKNGTKVEVFSIKRNKKVIVKVNDRMGKNARAIIDLSYKAAEEIGLITDRRTKVNIRVISVEK